MNKERRARQKARKQLKPPERRDVTVTAIAASASASGTPNPDKKDKG
jgi:hypothetical protein